MLELAIVWVHTHSCNSSGQELRTLWSPSTAARGGCLHKLTVVSGALAFDADPPFLRDGLVYDSQDWDAVA